jgi:hypothetical protein
VLWFAIQRKERRRDELRVWQSLSILEGSHGANLVQTSRVEHLASPQPASSNTTFSSRRAPIYSYKNYQHDLRFILLEITYTTHTYKQAPSFQQSHLSRGGNEHPLPSLPPSNLPPNPQCTAPASPPPSSYVSLNKHRRKQIRVTRTATIPTTAPTTEKVSPSIAK